jgi:DNA invertase Pin-like site-specific DNA recombinase
LTFQILGAVAEFERELLRERVKAGMAQARRAGKNIGRPALRHLDSAELERMRLLWRQAVSVRMAKNFATDSEPLISFVTQNGSGSAWSTTVFSMTVKIRRKSK